MYAKCGSIHNSLEVSYKSENKDIYCWTALISGLALHGFGYAVLKLFNQMRENCIKPDDITYGAGLFDSTLQLVERMPTLRDGEHMMFSNLYASCGQCEEAGRRRNMMNGSGIVKTAGCSEVEINGRFHKFLAGEGCC
ncbi:hypothetical protein TB1_042058 [Malus domestica]